MAYSGDWTISRYRFFMLALGASFCWYWLPDFIMPALSYFTFICWAAPSNRVVNQIFGMNSGMGLLPLTFDCEKFDNTLKLNSNSSKQGARLHTLAHHWWFLRGQSSMSQHRLFYGSGSSLRLYITQTHGLQLIYLSKATLSMIIQVQYIMLQRCWIKVALYRSTVQSTRSTLRFAPYYFIDSNRDSRHKLDIHARSICIEQLRSLFCHNLIAFCLVVP